MRWRIVGIVALVVVLGAGAALARPVLQGYLAGSREVVSPAPVQPVQVQPATPAATQPAKVKPAVPAAKPPKVTKRETTPTKAQPVEPKPVSRTRTSPPPVSSSGTAAGESNIDKAYRAELQKVGQYYQGQLNALLAQAYQGYLAVKEGKSHTSLLTLASEYMAKGEKLEKESDSQFNSILEQYRAALQKAGLPLTYEEQAQAEYQKTEAAEKQKILSDAEKYL